MCAERTGAGEPNGTQTSKTTGGKKKKKKGNKAFFGVCLLTATN